MGKLRENPHNLILPASLPLAGDSAPTWIAHRKAGQINACSWGRGCAKTGSKPRTGAWFEERALSVGTWLMRASFPASGISWRWGIAMQLQ